MDKTIHGMVEGKHKNNRKDWITKATSWDNEIIREEKKEEETKTFVPVFLLILLVLLLIITLNARKFNLFYNFFMWK